MDVKTDNGATESLQSSEVRYRRLFETAKDGILLLDGDTGRITPANTVLKIDVPVCIKFVPAQR